MVGEPVVGERLVVVALKDEAAHLPPETRVLLIGLGKTHAATAVAKALAAGGISEVVNLGTAGALRPGLTGIFEPSVVVNHDLSADVVRSLGHDPQEVLELAGGDGTVLATGDVFVTDPVVRDGLAERAHLVDMEGYAIAWACRSFGVPCRLVKHVSDAADESALDWNQAVDGSARALAEWLRAHPDEPVESQTRPD